MSSILLATSNSHVRERILAVLHAEGAAIRCVADWTALCAGVCAGSTRLAIVDMGLPGLDASALARLARGLTHRPVLRAIGEPTPGSTGAPIPLVPTGDRAVARLARFAPPREESLGELRRTLRWMGLGDTPMEVLARAASSPLPVLLLGERGTGKLHVARALHALAGGGPFAELAPDARALPLLEGASGTLYLPSAHLHAAERVETALRAGWRVVAGARVRETEALHGRAWTRVVLPPLRERPGDLRGLAAHYLEAHASRLGLGRRTLDRGTWTLLLGHRWPENARELERYLVELLVSVPHAKIRAAQLPPTLRARLSPDAQLDQGLESFEELARARLAQAVARWTPVEGTPSLHDHVIDATERALLQLALTRTEGNRRAAAHLLGLSRNTLHERIVRLGLDVAEGSPRRNRPEA